MHTTTDLTSASEQPPRRLIVPPPSGAGDLVHYFQIEAPSPRTQFLHASPFPVLVAVLKGALAIHESPGGWRTMPSSFAGGPFTRPLSYRAEPGTIFVAALLSPGRLHDLFGLDQRLLGDAMWPLKELASARAVGALSDRLAVSTRPTEWTQILGAWLVEQRDRIIKPDRVLQIANVFASPHALARNNALSLRQFERRFATRYGFTLRDARRVGRFIGALSAVLSDGKRNLATIAQDFGYFDHAHMSRDFNELAGHSPSRLVCAPADCGLDIFRYSAGDLDVLRDRERRERLLIPPNA
ncbi:helix-turn-helix domain-containing protein [Lysobacter sp. 1R34A]|uniref:AraC family transcriptional regulator n=1 Tax=Lysobacter sp. 1R34A TaxID=3445786 RepID=UPI003EE8E86D